VAESNRKVKEDIRKVEVKGRIIERDKEVITATLGESDRH
jgi:hypothetical protein